MPGIFEDDRRRNGPISTNPYRTGRISPPTLLRLLDGTPPHLRKRALSEKKFGSAGSMRQLTTCPEQ